MQKINLDTVEINNEFITVIGSSTIFANEVFHKKINISDIENQINFIKNYCKQNNIKLKGQRKISSQSKDILDGYNKEYELYKNKYQNLKILITEKVESGIYSPTSDDKEMIKIENIRFEINNMFLNNSFLSKFIEINRVLKRAIQSINMSKDNQITMINIG